MNSSVACDSGCPFPPIPPVLCSGKCSEKLIRNLAVSVIAERLVPLLCQCFPCLSHSKPLYYWPKPLLKIEIFSFFFTPKLLCLYSAAALMLSYVMHGKVVAMRE